MTSIKFILFTLAAMSSVIAETTCGPCRCFNDIFWHKLRFVASCWYNSNLTTIPADLPADIKVLSIVDCSISMLKDSQFKSYRLLQGVLIEVNDISQIEQGAFRYMTDLAHISLNDNNITELPSDCFTFSPTLTTVDVGKNKMKRLQTHLFSNLKYLKSVDLNYNEITAIEENCFVNVPKLEVIRLYENKLIALDIKLIDNPSSLKVLALSENPWHCDTSLCGVMDTVVSGELWHVDPWGHKLAPTCTKPQNMKNWKWSELMLIKLCSCFWCNCTNIPPAALCTEPRQLRQVPSRLPADIAYLNVTGQEIKFLKENDIIGYSKLEKLYLENNQIETLEAHAFNSLKNVCVISLRNNSLRTLVKYQFSNMARLKAIDLSRNKIQFISDDCFYYLPSLETLDLSVNLLEQLSVGFTDDLSKLQSLLLPGNPWRCNAALCGVMHIVVTRELWGQSEEPTCAAPADVRVKPWRHTVAAFQPQIISNKTSVNEGQDLQLTCKYCFPSRIVWTFNGIKLSRNDHKVCDKSLTSSLTLSNIRREQQGYYVCHVKHCEDCDDAWIYLNVNGTSHNAFDLRQAVHIPDVNTSESGDSRRGILVLHYTVIPATELNTTLNDKN